MGETFFFLSLPIDNYDIIFFDIDVFIDIQYIVFKKVTGISFKVKDWFKKTFVYTLVQPVFANNVRKIEFRLEVL